MEIIERNFTSELINWFSKAKRDLPWRATKEPYKIWLSEIILQQTRVDQGLPYYLRFVEAFPEVESLAKAQQQEVLKLWEGLGYYSRARNLHETARTVSGTCGGKFPGTYKDLLKLKGIGPYTAAAIASICYGEQVPVVDGNVFRFISRHFGIQEDIAVPRTRKLFETVLHEFIPGQNPGDFNQAVMEFGATVCKPAPDCGSCVFRQSCFAHKHKMQHTLPVKSKKTKVKERFLHYLVFHYAGTFLLHERTLDIWKGLYQFYLIENSSKELRELPASLKKFVREHKTADVPVKHLLSHRVLWVSFHEVEVNSEEDLKNIAALLELKLFSREEVLTLPKPKVIVNYLHRAVI